MGFRATELGRFAQPTDIAPGVGQEQEEAIGDLAFATQGATLEEEQALTQPQDPDSIVDAQIQESGLSQEIPMDVPETVDPDRIVSDTAKKVLSRTFLEKVVQRGTSGVGRTNVQRAQILTNQFPELEVSLDPASSAGERQIWIRQRDADGVARGPFTKFDPPENRGFDEFLLDIVDLSGEFGELGLDLLFQLIGRNAQKRRMPPKTPPSPKQKQQNELLREMGGGATAAISRGGAIAALRDRPLDPNEEAVEATIAAAGGPLAVGFKKSLRWISSRTLEKIPGFGRDVNAPEAFKVGEIEEELLADAEKLGLVEVIGEGGERLELPVINALDVFGEQLSPRLKKIVSSFAQNPVYLKWRRATEKLLREQYNKILRRRSASGAKEGSRLTDRLGKRVGNVAQSLRDELGKVITGTRQLISAEAQDMPISVSTLSNRMLDILEQAGSDNPIPISQFAKFDRNTGELVITNVELAKTALNLNSTSNVNWFMKQYNFINRLAANEDMTFPVAAGLLKRYQEGFKQKKKLELNALRNQMYNALATDTKSAVEELTQRGFAPPGTDINYINAIDRYSQDVKMMDKIIKLATDNPLEFAPQMMESFIKNRTEFDNFAAVFAERPEMKMLVFRGWMENFIGKYTNNGTKALDTTGMLQELNRLERSGLLKEFLSKEESNVLKATFRVTSAIQKTKDVAKDRPGLLTQALALYYHPFISTKFNSAMTIYSGLKENPRALDFLSKQGLQRNTVGLPITDRQKFVQYVGSLNALSDDLTSGMKRFNQVAKALEILRRTGSAPLSRETRNAVRSVLEEGGMFIPEAKEPQPPVGPAPGGVPATR